ncbi:Prefoldin alpha-like [Dillenia turbinata]|uniref:Prefoldin alpha-like n=1 Tax=Dillenia turbinata TaxID=194707 RepID=A0AAN8VHE7_9MAGN
MASRGGEMSIEQLKALKEQTDLEVNLLQDSLNNIRTATTRLELASAALHDLSLRPQGKKMLVPLTASLYVPGILDEADKVLVDVGTGYFIESNVSVSGDEAFNPSSDAFASSTAPADGPDHPLVENIDFHARKHITESLGQLPGIRYRICLLEYSYTASFL